MSNEITRDAAWELLCQWNKEPKSVRKKYKTANFAAGCSREVIERGARLPGWELGDLISRTILAMRSCEAVYEQF